jgi:O-acetyl-ADP-ribose deacetylase (regulator of RNase III)
METYKLVKADITLETEGLIVSGCNLSGANGSGLAGALKAKWPIVYTSYMKIYKKWKEEGDIFSNLGKIDVIHIENNLYVANGFTQKYCGYDGKRYADPEAVQQVLDKSFNFCSLYDLPLKTVRIGCDRGGLSWEDEIEPILLDLMKKYPEVNVTIFTQ